MPVVRFSGVETALAARRQHLAAAEIVTRAVRARENLAEFAELSIRAEGSPYRPITLWPHQALVLDFVWHCPMFVLRMPVGSTKTFSLAALSLFLLGRDPTERGLIVSSAESQSQKVLKIVRDHLEDPIMGAGCRTVFPKLRRSQRANEPWTNTSLNIDRPPGIKDPSLLAVGLDSRRIQGSRTSFIFADDVLNDENTHRKEFRDYVHQLISSKLSSRMSNEANPRMGISNTPYSKDDITYRYEKAGWPTLTMSVYGDVGVSNLDPKNPDNEPVFRHLRSARTRGKWRLRAFDPDPKEKTTIWPLKHTQESLAKKRKAILPRVFANIFECNPTDDKSGYCQEAWIRQCLKKSEGYDYVDRLTRKDIVEVYGETSKVFAVTGVDIAVAEDEKKGAKSVVFTILYDPADEEIQVLRIESGNWSMPKVRDAIIDHQRRYDSYVYVETNGTQRSYIDAVLEKKQIPIYGANTGKNKWDRRYGVHSVFIAFEQGRWFVPNQGEDETGQWQIPEPISEWLDECREFRPPPAHTGDHLMASWIALEGVRTTMNHADFFFDNEEDESDEEEEDPFATPDLEEGRRRWVSYAD